ncbi:MAG TPA: hypothetical protein DD979_18090 [Gammaproteobacteria bacterium]|jgi:O-antigen ligase|nr:hypothetical protein [Gammaproteobacteria bacterium]
MGPGALAAVGGLLGALYAGLNLQLDLSIWSYYLLCAGGFVTLLRAGSYLPLTENEKTGLSILLVFFLVSILSYWINGMPADGSVVVYELHAKFLFAIGAYYLFRGHFIPDRLIWLLAIGISFLLFVVALMDLNAASLMASVKPAFQPLVFGAEALTMVALIMAFRDDWSLKRLPRMLARLGILAALAAIWLRGDDRVWLALPMVLGLYLLSRRAWRSVLVPIVLLTLMAVAVFLMTQLPVLQARWAAMPATTSESAPAAWVTQPQLWQAAWTIIREQPLLGVGAGGFQTAMQSLVDGGNWPQALLGYVGPHNQYLQAWASHGIGGLVTVVLLILAPFLYCLRVLRASAYRDVRQVALAGMMVSAIFAVLCFVDDALATKSMILLYLITLALLLGQIRQRSRL